MSAGGPAGVVLLQAAGMDMDMNMTMSNCSDPMQMMSMKNSFFFGYQCSLLFNSFNLETPEQLVGGVILIMVVAILYEGLKTLREILASRETAKQNTNQVAVNTNLTSPGDNTPCVPSQIQSTGQTTVDTDSGKVPLVASWEDTQYQQPRSLKQFLLHTAREYCSVDHILQSSLHVVRVGVAYLLMLVAMTFNGWLFLAVCIGAGIGYFVFGKCRKSFSDFVKQSDHCN